MTDTKWLREDERTMFDFITRDASDGLEYTLAECKEDMALLLSRLAAERKYNEELTDQLTDWGETTEKRIVELVEVLREASGHIIGFSMGDDTEILDRIKAALAKNAGKPHFRSVQPVDLSHPPAPSTSDRDFITKDQFQKLYPPKKDD